jgi:hypothetical protein
MARRWESDDRLLVSRVSGRVPLPSARPAHRTNLPHRRVPPARLPRTPVRRQRVTPPDHKRRPRSPFSRPHRRSQHHQRQPPRPSVPRGPHRLNRSGSRRPRRRRTGSRRHQATTHRSPVSPPPSLGDPGLPRRRVPRRPADGRHPIRVRRRATSRKTRSSTSSPRSGGGRSRGTVGRVRSTGSVGSTWG